VAGVPSTRKYAVSQAISAAPAKPPRIVHDRPPMLAIGIMIWLGSELMFFSGLFAAFFSIRANDHPWPPVGTHLDVLRAGFFTLILVASSFTMQTALFAEERFNRRKARIWIGITLILGALFLYNQGYEWITQATRPGTNAYGSLFFIMTGLHGLHVFLGLVAMVFLLGRMRGPAGDPGELSVFQGISYYWHFVDIVWIGLYSCLFLLK
jgi:cytochrome c oxidase subunit 3